MLLKKKKKKLSKERNKLKKVLKKVKANLDYTVEFFHSVRKDLLILKKQLFWNKPLSRLVLYLL